MIAKEKMFIVAGNIDDSIRSVTPIYDIVIMPTFLKFEEYINSIPCKIGSIIISANELPFTAPNMNRLYQILNSKFLKLTGTCIYLIDEGTSREQVTNFFRGNNYNVVCYQGDLSMQFISEVVDGTARDADESKTEILTYRTRKQEYIQQQSIQRYESDDAEYITDEEELSDVPAIEQPEPVIPHIDILSNTYYVVGKPSIERSLFAFLEAQYLSTSGKVLLMESDKEYYDLTDTVTKSNVDYEYIDITDFIINCTEVITRIIKSTSRIVFLGSKRRIDFDYDFIYDILASNLLGIVDFFVRECDFDQTPLGYAYNVVCGDTVPEVLECISNLKYDVDEENVIFVGMRTRDLGSKNICSTEMQNICQITLEKPNIRAEVITAYGINLKGDNTIYDVFSLIGRGNQRQG